MTKLAARLGILCTMILLGGSELLAQPVYTPPELFRGALYLASASGASPLELSATQAGILQAEAERPTVSRCWTARTWISKPQLADAGHWSAEFVKQLQQLKRGSCLWIADAQLTSTPPEDRPARSELLRQCLNRGVLVILELGTTTAGSRLADQWQLVPDLDLVWFKEMPLDVKDLSAERASLQITTGSLLRIGRRELINLSEDTTAVCFCDCPSTKYYAEPLREAIAPRKMVDLVAVRRALNERLQPVFPSDTTYQPELKNGSLVIVGGGGAPPEIWEKFVELAGGKDARIVVLPTAMPEPEFEDDDEARLLKRFGASEVRILPQTSREDVSKEEFLNNLRWATGIWFGGGRQWRFVDAYWGTPAWDEIKQVTARGGVIGGSSAGATIQGDLLVRGHPLGNQIMIADGYRHGLGLLEGVAIDQHFKQRNRFDDLVSVAKRFPKVYGIGIDESTALVVQSPTRCSVIGKGSVWLLPPDNPQHNFIEHPSGDSFTLESDKTSK